MIPFLVLVISVLALRGAGAAGVPALQLWSDCFRIGLALMFLLTASAHWGRRRADLVRMVPAVFPRPDLMVTITGFLEILGAVGLLLPAATGAAAACLAILLIALFPANVRAARDRLTLAGKPATPLLPRLAMQIAFLAALVAAGYPHWTGTPGF